jgi:tRNA-Thr(GGU) m(6)t(6)A37 methyltransferase TsaA
MSDFLDGILLGSVCVLAWQCYVLTKRTSKFEEAYWGERRGRARVEREMKRISNIQLNTSEGFFVQPIGTISSCYRQCIGTPRQGLLVPASRASLTLTRNVSPEALVGLESFSHVWITFKFHLNTNTLKESKAFSSRSTFNAKISLPVLKDSDVKKMGVLATRSPHRPNPVGVTLARIWKIDKKSRTVYLHACDLVDGTPVLDIKVKSNSWQQV